MKVITKDELIQKLVDHPYETNPDLVARVNFFYFSPDQKLAVAYYESPPGWFDVEVDGFNEIDYILEGEVELISKNVRLLAQKGDCFQIQHGDKFRWQMNKESRMLFFIYPLTRQIQELIASFYNRKLDV